MPMLESEKFMLKCIEEHHENERKLLEDWPNTPSDVQQCSITITTTLPPRVKMLKSMLQGALTTISTPNGGVVGYSMLQFSRKEAKSVRFSVYLQLPEDNPPPPDTLALRIKAALRSKYISGVDVK